MSGHIIAVDDARLFNGRAGYPTLQELQAEVGARGASLTVKDDIIWIVPP